MKSKKIVALALTAAIAISTASATAFAASQTVKEKPALNEQTLTIKLNNDDKDKAASTEYKIEKGLDDTTLYHFVGWSKEQLTIEQFDSVTTDKAAEDLATDFKKVGTTFTIDDVAGEDSIALSGSGDKAVVTEDNIKDSASGKGIVLYPVFRRWASEEEAKEAAENAKKKADAEAAEKERKDKLDELDKANAATNNMKNVAEDKVETKAAAVSNPQTLASYDVYQKKELEHIFKIAGVDGEKDVTFAYEVGTPDGYKLVNGKNARVTLKLPSNYTTDGYKVTVYHVVDAYKKSKVTGLSVGKKDVTFWANDFSPYVLVLTPTDAQASGSSTSNPGTGDFSAVPVALLAAAALGATGVVAYKKRKAE